MTKKKHKASIWGYMVEESTIAAWLDHFYMRGLKDGKAAGNFPEWHRGYQAGRKESAESRYNDGHRVGFMVGKEHAEKVQKVREDAKEFARRYPGSISLSCAEAGWAVAFFCAIGWIITAAVLMTS